MSQQPGLPFEEIAPQPDGPVECLGRTFENDAARRAYFLERLREKLQDPEFRGTPGFPTASDEAILALSDPPWYTACPNPFLGDFVRVHGRPFDPDEAYEREPFAVDVSVGKTDALYKAHGYHTKVPHLAIVPSILHYTRPGDLVLDGFCGSGMTGVAAQWCGTAPAAYRRQLESEWRGAGHPPPEWGTRRVVLNDLGPAATFISANYNLPFDVAAFEREARRILDEVEAELGWMYETLHTDGKTKGRIQYTVWSEVFTCPECAGEVNFVAEALDPETNRVHEEFPCPQCDVKLDKDRLERVMETRIDPVTRETWRRIRLRPALIQYTVGKQTYEKAVEPADLELLRRIEALDLPGEVPADEFPVEKMYHGSRIAPKGFTRVHHFFLPRAAQALAALWQQALAVEDPRTRSQVLWFVEQAIWGMSVLARYAPTHFSQVNRQLSGVYYVGSQIAEVSPWYILCEASKRTTKLDRLVKSFTPMPSTAGAAALSTGDCAHLGLPDDSIDYIFTDPPFGENIYYADLNFLVEAWHRVFTQARDEAIVDRAKKKQLDDYQELMRRCFAEYHRVLKPGRWMTVVFSNSSNAVWRTIQEAMGAAGFVVADVRTLDKQQGSYRQVTSSAVKQDLVISAYKPTEALTQRFSLETTDAESAWAFVHQHLANVPVFVGKAGQAEVLVERTPQMLMDRMIAFHVQRGVAVPLSGPEFLAGLETRYVQRDGMVFTAEQAAEYDRKRTTVTEIRQFTIFVTDESSAVLWIRQQLTIKPQTYQEIQPQFLKQLQTWAKHEKTVELKVMLDENFLQYDGQGPVPSQIHSYLSSNFKELRNLDKEDPKLRDKAKGRWYVPDPSKLGDLEKLRDKALLKEFESYRETKKLKQFRTEAIRVGFKAAYERRDYQAIIEVAAKVPEKVLHEDEKLLMYLDVARLRLGIE